MDVWIERFDRVLTIIRPKAYNVIARIIIGLGIALVAESQLNILQAVIVASYESMFGYSEVLRKFIEGSSNPWIGLFLIVIGLIYHYFMTVGKQQIDLRLSQIPQKPILDLKLLNADLVPYENHSLNLRGGIVILPKDEIPEYKITYNIPQMSALNTFRNISLNPKFYKERSDFLKVWGGAELISLKLSNLTSVLATGVKIEITLPRMKGVSADNTKDDFPKYPAEKSTSQFSMPTYHNKPVHYDIKRSHNDKEYNFTWEVNDIQANTTSISDTYIFLRVEQNVDMEIKIFCDQYVFPVTEIYRVTKSKLSHSISISEITGNKESFDELVDKFIMDGYIQRVAIKRFQEYEHENQEVIPRS
ncbi:hypothetical protein [Shewanella frigidimarina]|uniref:Uncharacterized protein n=1 Tax=Shewanella frigidimarina (strain NCIMB 400) TaxID=318167 RepID=Q083P5_SHEFN|nr:hypothetical protein [Shewanella frigidimarina]ABI71520.1 hypothetical protein Sfri_1669 [Shewanella frigidimarina NCIMB 400]